MTKLEDFKDRRTNVWETACQRLQFIRSGLWVCLLSGPCLLHCRMYLKVTGIGAIFILVLVQKLCWGIKDKLTFNSMCTLHIVVSSTSSLSNFWLTCNYSIINSQFHTGLGNDRISLGKLVTLRYIMWVYQLTKSWRMT